MTTSISAEVCFDDFIVAACPVWRVNGIPYIRIEVLLLCGRATVGRGTDGSLLTLRNMTVCPDGCLVAAVTAVEGRKGAHHANTRSEAAKGRGE